GCRTQHHGGPPTPAGHPRRHQAMPGTHPNGAAPPGVGARAGGNHGNTKLWTAMWPAGVIKADPDYVDKDGSIHLELGWWRGVSGRLSIQGRRLDAPTPGALVRERPYAGTAVASITSMAASVRHGHGSGRPKGGRVPVWVEGLADLPARRLCP